VGGTVPPTPKSGGYAYSPYAPHSAPMTTSALNLNKYKKMCVTGLK